jgi:ferritin
MEDKLKKSLQAIVNKNKTSNPFVDDDCINILNFRIEQEEYSSRVYHAMSMYLNDKGYVNSAKRWQQDSEDEMVHASWAKDYLLDMGIQPKIPALKEPPQDYRGLADIIRKSYDHEVLVTKQCQELASHAMKSGNHLLYQLAFKYLKEQQEELGKLQTYIDQLEAFGEDKVALRLFDNSLA